jgi:uncharacterized protein (TIGR03435 family)
MKRFALSCAMSMAAFVGLSASALYAQNLTGTWQGALKVPQGPNGELRIVMKVSTTDADALKAVMYSIDQGAQPINAGAVTLKGTAVNITVPAIGGVYEGKLSADGNTITGTWSQGPTPQPLIMTKATAVTAWTIPEAPPPLKPMVATDPAFEVATIKPAKPDAQGKGINVNQSGQFSTRNTSLGDLITLAYGMHARQIINGPSWIDTDKFDINAKSEAPGMPNDKQVKTMLQKLLAERFELTTHRDKRELTAYTITVAKGGPKLKASEGDPNGLPGLGFRGLGMMVARNATISDMAGLFQIMVLDRPVVDQTGLTTRYDFQLNWTPDDSQFGGRGGTAPPAPAANGEVPPDLYTAIQQQLGLKMDSVKAPVDVMVIDHVEKPSAN